MGSVLAQLEQTSVAIWIRESGLLYAYPLVLFLHTLGLSTLVGLSSAIDIRILRSGAESPLEPLERLFALMWAGLAISAITGGLLFIADATRHASNPAFYVKLLFVVLAVVALLLIRKTVFRERKSGRVLAAASLACWFVALSAARLMAYISELIS
jgi:hypothetical protein